MTAVFPVLTSMRDIAAAFHVSRTTVRGWREEGAPIVEVAPRCFRADPDRLWEWLIARERERRKAVDGSQWA